MILGTRYRVLEPDADRLAHFRKLLSSDGPLSTLLALRCTPESARFFLTPNIQTMHSPFLFRDMERAVQRFAKAVDAREKVYVFADKDADGVTSAAILAQFVRDKGLAAEVYAPTGDSPYGFSKSNYDDAVKFGATLAIAVDTGITYAEDIAYGKSRGIDTIVLDHHEVQESLRPSCIAVDPKDRTDSYPFSGLSAAGVAVKFIWAYEFSRLPDFGRDIFLVNPGRDGDGVFIDVAVLRNFVTVSRECFRADGSGKFPLTLYDRVGRSELMAFREDRTLRRHLAGLNVRYMAREFSKYCPEVSRLDLSGVRKSKCRFFADATDTDALVHLYKTCFLRKNSSVSEKWLRYLDLAAISTVADMMPLMDENHIIARLGIVEINSRRRKNIQGILSQKNLIGKEISSEDISFYIAPVINSAGRLGRTEVALQLLLQRDEDMMDIYSREIMSINDERKKIKARILEESARVLEKEFAANSGKAVTLLSDAIPHGICGLIASDVKSTYGCVAVVVSTEGEKCSGSVRSVGDCDIVAVLSEFSQWLADFGGHRKAAGFTVKEPERAREFLDLLKARLLETEFGSDAVEELEVDAQLDASAVGDEMVKCVDILAPYGEMNRRPVFLIRNAVVKSFAAFRGKENLHLKMTLGLADSFSLPAIFWNNGESASLLSPDVKVNVLAVLDTVYYRMQKEYRFTIIDMEVSG